jgi:hypothetical protein
MPACEIQMLRRHLELSKKHLKGGRKKVREASSNNDKPLFVAGQYRESLPLCFGS